MAAGRGTGHTSDSCPPTEMLPSINPSISMETQDVRFHQRYQRKLTSSDCPTYGRINTITYFLSRDLHFCTLRVSELDAGRVTVIGKIDENARGVALQFGG